MKTEKLITFAVPCYNSAAYMENCIKSLLTGGDEVEIIIVDDGSKDNTGEIADKYAAEYPDIIKVIHQENGGHGEGVNQGIRHATGLYYKVVDSDDKLEPTALKTLVNTIKEHIKNNTEADLYIVNFIYDKVYENKRFVRDYKKRIRANEFITWSDFKRFKTSEMILMHSIVYKTEVLRASDTSLPKHTFYVDNIFSYKPLPFVKKIYYLDVDMYLYFIGRADQSVTLENITKRYEQQIRVMKEMINAYSYEEIERQEKGLRKYMLHSLSVIMMLTQMFTSNGKENKKQRKQDLKDLWKYIKNKDKKLYKKLRYRSYNALCCWMPFPLLRFVTKVGYNYFSRTLNCS